MKNIKVRDITDVRASKIAPGHILAEGIVLDVVENGDLYFHTAADGTIVFARPDQSVQVYGQVSRDMVDAIIEAKDAAR